MELTLKEQSKLMSKIRRYPINMGIHNLFIFRKSGICIFGKNFTQRYKIEENLISAFFTAIRSFTQEVVGEKVKIIEMGHLKFAIIKRERYYYGFLCDKNENMLILNDITKKIHNEYITLIKRHNITKKIEHIKNINFDKKIDKIIEKILSTEYDIKKEEKIIDQFKKFSNHHEVNGTILLTNKGRVIFSSLKSNELTKLLNEVNFRIKSHNNSIVKMCYNYKSGDIILSENVNDLYFVIFLFNNKTSLGLADYYLNKAVQLIKTTINNRDLKKHE